MVKGRIMAQATMVGMDLPGTFELRIIVSNGVASHIGGILISESELSDMAEVIIPVLVEEVVREIKNQL